ncbi:MAG: nuclear transport factor 2 family protein [bacterium]
MGPAWRGAPALLREYVSLHNRGVRDGELDALAGLFAEDAVLTFVGIPAGPFNGRSGIRRAFEARPPTDELVIGEVEGSESEAAASYAWRSAPGLREGTIRLRAAGGKIATLRIERP